MIIICFYCSMDEDGSLKVSWDEWRNYLILHPSADLKDIYMYWRHATVSPDIGQLANYLTKN